MTAKTFKISTQHPAARAARVAFPEYKGRKYTVVLADSVLFCELNWAGGTRNQYRAMKQDASGRWHVVQVGGSAAPWANAAEGARAQLTNEVAVIEHSVFCGQDMGIRIYVCPAQAPYLLP